MKRRSHTTSRRHRRSGQSLLLFFFLLVALIGVMALTLDFGFVLLARRQMQTGVNTAALEGLRGRGLPNYDANDEQLRREAARDLLRLTYDDNFDLAENNTTIGAGIDSSLVEGHGFRSTTIGPGDTQLPEDLANRSAFVFRPDGFQLNQANEQHGDMVVGAYSQDADHFEAADYSRPDFDPTSASPDSFLVRMRRTPDLDNLDNVAGVSSSGGGLPLLLARGGWTRAADGAGYSVRRDGVVVRAAAIARAVPARAVGVADLTVSPRLVGVAPFAIEEGTWEVLDESETYILDTMNGNLTGMGVDVTARDVDNTSARFVGELLAAAWSPPRALLAAGDNEVFYMPVFREIAVSAGSAMTNLPTVIGFVRIRLAGTAEPTELEVTPLKQVQVVAPENAASLPAQGWQDLLRGQVQVHPNLAGLTAEQRDQVLADLITEVFGPTSPPAQSLLAPALVRTAR